MRKINIIILMLFSFIFFAFGNNNSKTYLDNGTEDILTEEELKKYVILALNGDLYAAYDLFNHYMSVPMQSKDEFLQKTQYWAIIAAENDTYGRNMYTLYSFNRYSNCISDTRSIFWLQKSARLKYKDSINEIERLQIPIENNCNLDIPPHNFNLEKYKKYAEFGNQIAAVSLVDYYKELDNTEQIKYWLRIGAQNGSKECMKEYAELLRKSSDKYDNIRAEFWEKKAKS
ncbi:MAG: hypothetical protein ACI4LX_07410 [Treponema sp.]